MPNPLTYRLANAADLPTLVEMRWAMRTELHPPSHEITRESFFPVCLEFLQKSLAGGQWAFWVAEQDGGLIANAYLQRVLKVPSPNRLDPEFGYITNVYTRPAQRGQGVGAGLIRHMQAWARQERLEMLILWPSERSAEFYRRLGFTPSPEGLECDLKQI